MYSWFGLGSSSDAAGSGNTRAKRDGSKPSTDGLCIAGMDTRVTGMEA